MTPPEDNFPTEFELPETPGMVGLPQSPDAAGNVLEAPAADEQTEPGSAFKTEPPSGDTLIDNHHEIPPSAPMPVIIDHAAEREKRITELYNKVLQNVKRRKIGINVREPWLSNPHTPAIVRATIEELYDLTIDNE